MPEGMTWDKIPEVALVDCAHLVKANSIEGIWSLHLATASRDADTILREQEGQHYDNLYTRRQPQGMSSRPYIPMLVLHLLDLAHLIHKIHM
jgi:hypothetical protein